MSWDFLARTVPRDDPTARFGPESLTPERLAEIEAWLADVGPNDRNDPECFAVVNYVEDLLAALKARA